MEIIIVILLFLALLSISRASLIFAPWVPVFAKDLPRINAAAALRPGDVFYDLGSGDGKVVLYLAQKNQQAKCIGVEMVSLLWLWSVMKKILLRINNAQFKLNNFYQEDISRANVIYFFGTKQGINKQFIARLSSLKKGTRVISLVFSIPGWQAVEEISSPGRPTLKIYRLGESNLQT